MNRFRDFGPFYVKSQAINLSGVSTGVIDGFVTLEDLRKTSKIIVMGITSEPNSLTGDPPLKRRGWGNYNQVKQVTIASLSKKSRMAA